jgi:hypothetical protein
LCLAGQIQGDEADSLPDGQTIRAPFSVKPWLNPVKQGSRLKENGGFFARKQSETRLAALSFPKFNLFAGE